MGNLLLAGWALFALVLGWLAAERPSGPTRADAPPPKNHETREDER